MAQSPNVGAEPLDIEPLEVKFSDDETNDEKMQHEVNEDDDMQEAQSQPEEEAEGKDQVSDSQFIRGLSGKTLDIEIFINKKYTKY
ncbi:hypothetical protein P8452_06117 [Trifolium repens]|nr:hypothetical protein P8452_06117 [Trifolium repens]